MAKNAGGTTISVQMKDNTDKVLEALKQQIPVALEAVGGEMERHAKEGCPVDTGRLRNSITFATSTAQGAANTSGGAQASPNDFMLHGSPDDKTVVIGTNVEYAAENEYYNKTNAHFLKNAATGHSEDYKNIVKAALST